MKTLQTFAFLLASHLSPLGAAVVVFDELPSLPASNSFALLSGANSGSSLYAGVQWDDDVFVVGKDYVEAYVPAGPNRFATPHSGLFAISNANGVNNIDLNTTLVLAGVWLSRIDLGNGPYGATSVTITAYTGATPIGSETLALTSTTPTFLDTSSFIGLSGITGYRITRVAQSSGIAARVGGWVADDFQFVPEPSRALLLCLGASLVGCRRKRKQNRNDHHG
jgi:hypothetical protein